MPNFEQTRMGQKFYEHTVPNIAKQLKRIADEIKRSNDINEKLLLKEKEKDNDIKFIINEEVASIDMQKEEDIFLDNSINDIWPNLLKTRGEKAYVRKEIKVLPIGRKNRHKYDTDTVFYIKELIIGFIDLEDRHGGVNITLSEKTYEKLIKYGYLEETKKKENKGE